MLNIMRMGLDAQAAQVKANKENDMQNMIFSIRLLQANITKLLEIYPDNRGNLEESLEYAGYILLNMQGHLHDVQQGKEEFCHCGKCDDCVAARSDEHYDRKRDGQLEVGS